MGSPSAPRDLLKTSGVVHPTRERAGARPGAAGAPRPKRGLRHESRVLVYALLAGALPLLVALILTWTGDYTAKTQWTLTLLMVGTWLSFAFGVRSTVAHPLQTLSNMQAALREGDFSIRARGARHDDSLGELMYEVNALSEELRQQRLGALEATALLSKVMAEIDVAVFTFDGDQRLRFVNRAGERLLGRTTERLLGSTAAELDLGDCLEGESAHTLERSFPGGAGRWGIRRSHFRQGGVPHHLLVIADLSRALREEERQAWQRLVRVLGHELNNSLAPIKSIAQSLADLSRREPRPHDWEGDMRRGLEVVAERADALSRFMTDYARLARLPAPQLQPVEFGALLRRVVALETRQQVRIEPGPELRLKADPDQLEQLLINILRNAVDAAQETGGGVSVGWMKDGRALQVWVDDEGPGISNAANLFVPFFTTKPGGSGIGLALSRQIAEAHGGTVWLENRGDGKGCVAHVRLPL